MPNMAIKIITAKGNALTMAAVCKAVKPPAISSTAATAPSVTTQKERCHHGVSLRPPAASESITNDPESDDVTKKVIINKTVNEETNSVKGRFSNNLNKAMAWSFCTSLINEV